MRSVCVIVASSWLLAILCLGGCSTAPKFHQQKDFMARAESSTAQFKRSVPGLDAQIASSAAYVIFPDVARWGILFSGGTYGRGALYRPDGKHIGWAALNTGSIGLQAGVEGFRMLMVLQDERTLLAFMKNQLTGSVSSVVVVGETAAGGTAKFEHGVAVYEGAASGLMGGVNVGLNYVRYKPLGDDA